jgi:hypothetical protein
MENVFSLVFVFTFLRAATQKFFFFIKTTFFILTMSLPLFTFLIINNKLN